MQNTYIYAMVEGFSVTSFFEQFHLWDIPGTQQEHDQKCEIEKFPRALHS